MQSEDTIPTPAFAIAACGAATAYGEDPADLFYYGDTSSRARLVAISALKVVYPAVPFVDIARNFGFEGTGKRLSTILESARYKRWWSDETVDAVARSIRMQLRVPASSIWVVRNAEPVAAETPPDRVRAVFVPRKVHPVPLAAVRAAARRQNVTAELMGDPGARSARVARNERSSD